MLKRDSSVAKGRGQHERMGIYDPKDDTVLQRDERSNKHGVLARAVSDGILWSTFYSGLIRFWRGWTLYNMLNSVPGDR